MSHQTTSRQLIDIKIVPQTTELEGALKTAVLSLGCVQLNGLTVTSVVIELRTGHLAVLSACCPEGT